MCAFIVNPAIEEDVDYYRSDDAIVDQVLAGHSKLVIGLRRSGKTSFLYRVQRAARARSLPCEYFDLRDLDDQELDRPRAASTIVLVDELDVIRGWDAHRADRLVRLLRGVVAVVAAAPELVLDEKAQHPSVQRFVEPLSRHALGPLSDGEARDLLAQRKRGGAGPLSAAQVDDIVGRGERLPLMLQALGEEAAGTTPTAVSLYGLGARVLSGLTAAAHDLLVEAAHGASVAPSNETALLIETGALRLVGGAAQIGSPLLAEHVRLARPRATRVTAAEPAPRWETHARILHLSDLHFGYKSIDKPEVQARRMLAALERADRIPDFVVVTGDLSWSGHRNELKDAEVFLERIVAWLHRHRGWDDLECRRRILIVPGNHEASWSLSRGIPDKKRPPTDDEIEHWARYSLAPFANFANRFYRRVVVWDLDEPHLTSVFEAPSVAFLSLSTAHYITPNSNVARFGPQLVECAQAALGRDDVKRASFRIALWHHNLRTFHNQPSAIADADPAVRSFLAATPALDLALHGHVHHGEVDLFHPRDCSQTLVYSAVGSFGVEVDHRPGDSQRGRVHNQLAIVELQTGTLGRRMLTEFYDLAPDPDLQWAWTRVKTSDPRMLVASGR